MALMKDLLKSLYHKLVSVTIFPLTALWPETSGKKALDCEKHTRDLDAIISLVKDFCIGRDIEARAEGGCKIRVDTLQTSSHFL